MARVWYVVLVGFFVMTLSGCGLFNPPAQEDNPQNPNLDLKVSTLNVSAEPGTFVLVPVDLSSRMESSVVYAKLILNYDPNTLEYAGVYANTNRDAQGNLDGAGRLSLELFGTYKDGVNPDHIAFKVLNSQTSRVQFHLIEAATQNGEHRNFANANALSLQTQVAESRVSNGAGGLSTLPVVNQVQYSESDLRGISLNLQVPSKLEPAWAGVEMGDLNGDKLITKDDWGLLLKAISGQIVLTPVQRYSSDLRGDNVINIVDFAYLLAKQLNIQYGKGSVDSPLVVIHADSEVIPGNAALILVGNPLTLAPAANIKFTLTNSADWITDPISSTGSSTNAYSILAPIEIEIGKKTKLQVRTPQKAEYRLDNGTERQILAVAAPAGTATSISVVPGAVLFTAINQSKTFRVVAYDANRQQVSVNPTEFSWVVNDPNQVSLTNNNNGTVTVTSKTAVGSAFVSARITNGALIANPAAITIATPKPDVVILPDSAVLFPPVNPMNVTTVASINANGVASFTGDELAAYLEAPTPFTAKYPVVLRGAAPTVGSLVVSGEGSSVFGRVLQTQTRGAYSLVQLQLVPFPEAFSSLELKANSTELQAQGVLPLVAINSSLRNQVGKTTTQSATRNNTLQLGNCTITGTLSAGAIKAEGELVTDPFFEFSASTANNSMKIKIGANIQITLLATLVLSPTLTAKALCPLTNAINIDVPLSGPFYKLLTGRISNKPYFEAELKGQGGGLITAVYNPKYKVKAGFELAIDNSNPQFTNIWDDSKSEYSAVSITYSPPSSEQIPVKLYGSGFLNWRADFGIQVLALFTDIATYTAPSSFFEKLEQLQQALFAKFLTIRAGPKFGIGWGNLAYTLKQRIPGTGSEINAVVEGELGFKQLEDYANTFLGKVIPLSFTLKYNAYKLPLYVGVKPGKLLLNGQEVLQGSSTAPITDPDQQPSIEIKRNTTEKLEVTPEAAVGDEFSDVASSIPDVFKSSNEYSLYIRSSDGYYSKITKPYTTAPNGTALSISIPSTTLCSSTTTTDPFAVYVVYTNKLLNLVATPSLAGTFRVNCEADPDAKIEFSEKAYALGAKPNGSQTRKLLIKNVGSKDLKLKVQADTKTTNIDWLRLEGNQIIIEQDLPVGKIVEVAFVAKCLGAVEKFNGVINVSARSKDLDFPASGNGDANVELSCSDTGQPAPPRSPPGGDPGGGSGEPHIASFDGVYYDFQGAGEYIYAKSKVDSFQAQVRFTKFGSYLSVNQSFALNVNGDRVGIYGNKLGGTESYDILVNGVKQTFASDGSFYLELPKGGKITASHVLSGSTEGEFVDVRWADGYGFTANGAQPFKPFSSPGQYIWLSATVYIPADKRGLVQGLLGNDNQNPQDDFELRDGTKVVYPFKFQDLYGKFGARGLGWRISQSESLFDYEPGTNTDTFTDINYPSKIYGISDIALVDYEIAKAICQAAGIVYPQSLDNCILDLYLTGDPAFVRVAKRLDPIAKSISINPPSLSMSVGSTYQLSASVKGVTDSSVTWSATGGSISSLGVYTAPNAVGNYKVVATSLENPTLKFEVNVTVQATGNTSLNIKRVPLSTSFNNSSIIRSASIITWGENLRGQLGIGNQNPQNQLSYAQLIFSSTAYVAQLANGIGHGLALVNSSTNQASQVYSWGYNDRGQLGLASNVPLSLNQASPRLIPNLDGINIVAVSSQDNHNLALTQGGEVYSWGANDSGQLGLGDVGSNTGYDGDKDKDRNVPTLIPNFNNIVSVSAGSRFSVALNSAGQVYTWGYNSSGELGLGDNSIRINPTLVSNLTDVSYVVAIGNHCFAITKSGQVYAWGYNGYGELGLGNTVDQKNPTLVSALSNIVAFGGGLSSTLALTQNGQVYGFGGNRYGELGLGDTTRRLTPTLIPNFVASALSVCYCEHNLVFANGGQLYAWGLNSSKQLGLGDTVNRSVPTLVPLPIEANRVVPTTPVR